MTPRRVFDEERVFEPRRDQTAGLGLFAGDAPAEPRVEMLGAGQAARADARQRQTRKRIEDTYRILALTLEAFPAGLTRKELAFYTSIPVNSINARIAEMRSREDEYRVVTDGRRDGESVCHLHRLRTP